MVRENNAIKLSEIQQKIIEVDVECDVKGEPEEHESGEKVNVESDRGEKVEVESDMRGEWAEHESGEKMEVKSDGDKKVVVERYKTIVGGACERCSVSFSREEQTEFAKSDEDGQSASREERGRTREDTCLWEDAASCETP
ncbi:uncharacterized [Tachysurus ichikawai]